MRDAMRDLSKQRSAGLWLAACLFGLAGCDDSSSSASSDPSDHDAALDDAAEPEDMGKDDAGAPPGNGDDDDEAPLSGPKLEAGALGITHASGGRRTDPEGIAPASDTTKLSYRDAQGYARSLTLGAYLYQYDFSFDDNQQRVERSVNDDAWGHPGFGYVVSHNTQNGNSPLGKANAASRSATQVFSGAHHAIHRIEFTYDRDREGGGRGIKIPVVIDWFVATGRDHPVWAVTFKMSEVENPNNVSFDAYRMDTRAPYGSLNFDGAATRAQGDAIGGVAWGDADYVFSTQGNGLSLNSAWTYNQANRVNFTRTWTKATNAEFGIVQTRAGDRELSYGDRVVGRERGKTSADDYLLKGDCTAFGDARNYSMPCIAGWPYQLMNYDWAGAKPVGEETGTKLMAWGSPYGYLGASSFDHFDYSGQSSGRGDRSYATFIVVGPKCRFDGVGVCNQPGDVANHLKQVEALVDARISEVTRGALSAEAARGPGASSKKALAHGYNDTYAAYYLDAEDSGATFRFTPAPGKPVHRPIFVLQGYTSEALPEILLGDVALAYNQDAASEAFVSFDAKSQALWVTLNRTLDDAVELTLRPTP